MKKIISLLIVLALMVLTVPVWAAEVSHEAWIGAGSDSTDTSVIGGARFGNFGFDIGGMDKSTADKEQSNFGIDFIYFVPCKRNFNFYFGGGIYSEEEKGKFSNGTYSSTSSRTSSCIGFRFYPTDSVSFGIGLHDGWGVTASLGIYH